MPPPAARHSSVCGAQEKMDRVLRFLHKGLAGPVANSRLSPEHCERLARVFCAHGGHGDFNNHLQALVRGLKAEEDLCTLASSDSEKDVRTLVRLPVRELAPKARKEQRAYNENTACESKQYTKDFRKQVIEKFDYFDALHSLACKDRLTFGEKPALKKTEPA